MKYFVEVNGRERQVELTERLGELSAIVDGRRVDLEYENVDGLGQLLVLSEGSSYAVSIEGHTCQMGITIAGHLYGVQIEDERERAAMAAERAAGKAGGLLKSVMPGVVIQFLAAEGDHVKKGQPLLILEAMKMQNEIESPSDGVLTAFFVREGEAIGSGGKLARIEATPE